MLNNFIYAQTKDLFLEKLNAGEVLDEAIVFIEDTKEIWNYGHYFAGESIDPELLEQIQTSIQELKANVNDNPFEKGDAENSAVLKGGNNQTTSECEVALGKYNASNYDTQFSIGIGTSEDDRKNAFEVKQNGDIYIEGVEGRIQDKLDKLVNITYSELKSLRDDNKLIPGQQYRITDFVTTVADKLFTRSVGHQFDVIVLAINKDKLAEEAFAAVHEGDTYFTEAGANLNAWQIWYCLDNDTERFAWADATNGKGVIYRMIDEWNNDVPYDFKNVIYIDPIGFKYTQWGSTYVFARNASLDKNIDGVQYYGYTTNNKPTAWSSNDCWLTDELPATSSAMYKDDGTAISYGGSIVSVNDESKESYTFGTTNGDYSMLHVESEDILHRCIANVIGAYIDFNGQQSLNKILFEPGATRNTFGANCSSNSFSTNCSDNSFGPSCYGNSFGHYCNYNSFGAGCRSNSFGDYCGNNSFGSNCGKNSFEDNCDYNRFGAGCAGNSFGVNCPNNSFGVNCSNNSFGVNCSDNSFGVNCSDNSFGDSCEYNSFEGGCVYNSFGHYCNYNSFGAGCIQNSFTFNASTIGDCFSYNNIESGISYLRLENTETASTSNHVQHYSIHAGVGGSSDTGIATLQVSRGRNYETWVGARSNGRPIDVCLADIIAKVEA